MSLAPLLKKSLCIYTASHRIEPRYAAMSDTEEADYPAFGSYAFDQFVIVGCPCFIFLPQSHDIDPNVGKVGRVFNARQRRSEEESCYTVACIGQIRAQCKLVVWVMTLKRTGERLISPGVLRACVGRRLGCEHHGPDSSRLVPEEGPTQDMGAGLCRNLDSHLVWA
jgi:hypothetical protein